MFLRVLCLCRVVSREYTDIYIWSAQLKMGLGFGLTFAFNLVLCIYQLMGSKSGRLFFIYGRTNLCDDRKWRKKIHFCSFWPQTNLGKSKFSNSLHWMAPKNDYTAWGGGVNLPPPLPSHDLRYEGGGKREGSNDYQNSSTAACHTNKVNLGKNLGWAIGWQSWVGRVFDNLKILILVKVSISRFHNFESRLQRHTWDWGSHDIGIGLKNVNPVSQITS